MARLTCLFEFVQFEFTHAIGPPAARYIVAPVVDASSPGPARKFDPATGVTSEVGVADVLVIGVAGSVAATSRSRRARRASPASPPDAVSLSLAMFVKGTVPITDEAEAQRRLETTSRSERLQQDWVDDGLRVVNRAIRAYRAGAQDPLAGEVDRRDPFRIRIGYGSTDQVTQGLWQAVFEPALPSGGRLSKVQRLGISDTTAGILAGRARVYECEEMLLRTILDLDQRRTRSAAHQAYGALTLLCHELDADAIHAHDRADRLSEYLRKARIIADATLEGPLGDDDLRELEAIVAGAQRIIDSCRWPAARS